MSLSIPVHFAFYSHFIASILGMTLTVYVSMCMWCVWMVAAKDSHVNEHDQKMFIQTIVSWQVKSIGIAKRVRFVRFIRTKNLKIKLKTCERGEGIGRIERFSPFEREIDDGTEAGGSEDEIRGRER